MGKIVTMIYRATWWQVGLLVALAVVSLLDLTPPRVAGGILLLAFALLIAMCKLLARGNRDAPPQA